MKKSLLLLAVSSLTLFTSCSDENEPADLIPAESPKELLLSIGDKFGNHEIDGVDLEFDILSGNGNYIAIYDTTDARVVITDNHVNVALLTNNVALTIKDQKDQTQTIVFSSDHDWLIPRRYTICMDIDQPENHTADYIDFGAGGYSITKLKGNSASVSVVNDIFSIEALAQGNSYFQIADKRGVIAPLKLIVSKFYEYVGAPLTLKAINDQSLSVILKSGRGDWRIESVNEGNIINNIALMKNATVDGKYSVLQIDTVLEEIKGSAIIILADSENNNATIQISI